MAKSGIAHVEDAFAREALEDHETRLTVTESWVKASWRLQWGIAAGVGTLLVGLALHWLTR